ncbi:MAG: sugar phosphate isomerase/epimerase [Bryobacteraceae bacterium]|nr:sugar phosphate isomerase/epimerase [Bryobacteraceae bacterium]
MTARITRRSSLLALAASGAGASDASPNASARSVPVGIATTQFRDQTNQSLAAELKKQGVRHIQLFFTQRDSDYWRYGVPSDLKGMTPGRAKEIADIYHAAGMTIHGLGVYATLIHPDPADRKANLAYFEAMMKLGEHVGTKTFLSEMGHYQPPGPAPRVAYDWQDEVWKTAIASARELARMADAHGATLLLEPIYRSVLASAKRTRVFLEEVGSPRVRAQLDPANLLEVNDLEEMYAQLKPWIGGIHAKDRKLHVTEGVPAGQGDLDYRKFVTLSVEHAPGIPLIVEYVGTSDYAPALAHLRKVIREAGLTEA